MLFLKVGANLLTPDAVPTSSTAEDAVRGEKDQVEIHRNDFDVKSVSSGVGGCYKEKNY